MHDTDAFLCEIFDNTNPNQKCLVLVFRGTQERADIRTDLKGSSKPSPLPAKHKMGTEGVCIDEHILHFTKYPIHGHAVLEVEVAR